MERELGCLRRGLGFWKVGDRPADLMPVLLLSVAASLNRTTAGIKVAVPSTGRRAGQCGRG